MIYFWLLGGMFSAFCALVPILGAGLQDEPGRDQGSGRHVRDETPAEPRPTQALGGPVRQIERADLVRLGLIRERGEQR